MREEKKVGTLNDQEAKILLACLRNNQNQSFRQEEERNEFALSVNFHGIVSNWSWEIFRRCNDQ